jgi:FMN phosphatase YigB (HAD superfamily)
LRVSQASASTVVTRLGATERMLLDASDRLEVFGSQRFVEQALDDLRWEGVDGRLEVVSLDVFDTLLVRNDTSEIRRFWEISQAVADVVPGVDARDVLQARLTATRACYRTSRATDGYREGELRDIYRTALALLGVEEDLCDAMVACELDYEVQSLTLNPAVPPMLQSLDAGVVVAVSNMYLSVAHLSDLIERVGATRLSRVYTSTESRTSKNDSRLLSRVQSDLAASASSILHIGDSRASDFLPAKRLGWHAQLWPISTRSRERRRQDAVRCIEELERLGLALGTRATHYVANA